MPLPMKKLCRCSAPSGLKCSDSSARRYVSAICLSTVVLLSASGSLPPFKLAVAADQGRVDFRSFSDSFCLDCHAGANSEARVDIEAMKASPLEENYADWRRVRRVLQEGSMPPADGEQPSEELRAGALASLQRDMEKAVAAAAKDPGPSMVRRLTNAEYDYCIEDLTGLDLRLSKGLVSDSVGGSGFTNSATAQFMQDTTLERYLEAAKIVADHAMIGTGPLYFYQDAGQTGLELSAVERIQAIYRKYGFRAAAGEGAEPYGMDRFPRAFTVAWKYRYRAALEQASISLQELAKQTDIEPAFAEHIWQVLNNDRSQFPLNRIVSAWNQIPGPQEMGTASERDERLKEHTTRLFEEIQHWQARLASAASDEEEAALLGAGVIEVPANAKFVARAIRKRIRPQTTFTPDTDNKAHFSEDGRVRFRIRVESASDETTSSPVVVFSNPRFEFRTVDRIEKPPVPLKSVADEGSIEELQFGSNPNGEPISDSEFVVGIGQTRIVEVELPAECRVGELSVAARLDRQLGTDSVVRCTIQDITNEGNPKSSRAGREYSTLLRDPQSAHMDEWQNGLQAFALALPQISHREPTPSDRDPIPNPYNNAYNLPERNFFHTAVKYHRDDEFLRNLLIPEPVREELNRAWADLLTSFDYHNVNLRFADRKFDLSLGEQGIETLANAWIESLPSEIKSIVAGYQDEYQYMQSMLRSAEERHLLDLHDFAARAWRRPLSVAESQELTDFYQSLRLGAASELEFSKSANRERTDAEAEEESGLGHAAAIRASLARILVSPEFLYRLERVSVGRGSLDDHALASRLSFALWSSLPDEQLCQLAGAGRLSDPNVLRSQVARMLKSPKARRMATEFFGQWLGFYQFDAFRGVDIERFPEFDQRLKRSLYDEAISFFEFILREDRPYHEIFEAEYGFLNDRIAQHYRVPMPSAMQAERSKNQGFAKEAGDASSDERNSVSNQLALVNEYDRGGVLGLGAVLTVTSAPLRTSPVKRGDWILRRLIGTPVPPPPADAGSIPAEEVLEDGLTVRQRLEMHRKQAECMNCHERIDPLGFALENFDSLGRWRDTYQDHQAIDASGRTANGDRIDGLEGLKRFLRDKDELVRRNLAAKLVAYSLGRTETVHDTRLIERIAKELEGDTRLSTAVATLVTSPQFRLVRGIGATDKLTQHTTQGQHK